MRCVNDIDYTLYDKMLKSATNIVVISEYIRKELAEKFSIELTNKITIIPNSISINMEDIEQCERISTPFILDINRYAKHKNAITLLKAFEIYIKQFSGDAELVFVGFGSVEYLNTLKEYSKEHGIADKVHFMWKLETSKKNWLLKNASLFISPSLNEGMGRTPIEAMLCEIPTLTTMETSLYEATLGLAEYCKDPCDENEMAEKIHKILTEGENSVKLKEIKQRVKEEYAVHNILDKYERLFSN